MSLQKEKHITQIIGKIYDQMLRAVSETEGSKTKNIVLFTGKIHPHMIRALSSFSKKTNRKIRVGLFHDSKKKLNTNTEKLLSNLDIIITCDTSSPSAIQRAILPYQDELLAVTCRAEDSISLYAALIPHIPYVKTPSAESLAWASDKVLMRERLTIHNKDISPRFMVAADNSKATIKKIEEDIGFPLMVKPAGLAASRLVSLCFHKEELEEVLKKVFKNLDEVYKSNGGSWEPKVLVEQFVEGEMFSIDAYVDSVGNISYCPMVHVKTGRTIGFDDFFGYQQMTPTLLNEESITTAEFVASEAIHGLGLHNTTAHVEMMKTEQGWKIIELGARIGGFRHMMYEYSYDINHTANDVLIHMGEKPVIPKKIKGYTVAMKFFAKKEGVLKKLSGIKKIQDLKSFKWIDIHKAVGDQCLFAKHGGSSIFDLIMFNKDRSALLADIRRVEQTVIIETE